MYKRVMLAVTVCDSDPNMAGFAVLTPAGLTFGNQAVNTTSAAKAITVANSGAGTLDLGGGTITGPNADNFAVQMPGAGQSLISSGSSTTIMVTFTPTTGGRGATLLIDSNGINSPQAVPLSGNGT